jgi:hypothetical protein
MLDLVGRRLGGREEGNGITRAPQLLDAFLHRHYEMMQRFARCIGHLVSPMVDRHERLGFIEGFRNAVADCGHGLEYIAGGNELARNAHRSSALPKSSSGLKRHAKRPCKISGR